MTDLINEIKVQSHHTKLTQQRQRQVAHLYAAGPRPVLEALLAVEAGECLDEVLAGFASVSVFTYRMLGADELPIEKKVQ
jgi:hypothetical protein